MAEFDNDLDFGLCLDDVESGPDFEHLSLLLQSHPLRLEGGNVVIKLGDGPQDILLVHGHVLAQASERFAARLNSSHWQPTREVKVTATDGQTAGVVEEEKTVRVFEYCLSQVEDTFCLTDEKDASTKADSSTNHEQSDTAICAEPRHVNFCSSSLVDGHQASSALAFAPTGKAVRAQSVYEHKVLFCLLYSKNLDIDLGTASEAVATLFDITALADYYLLLPSLAQHISSHVEAISDIWKIISQDPEPYIILGTKLRSHAIFCDALRHFVGRFLECDMYSRVSFSRSSPNEDILHAAREMHERGMQQTEGLKQQLRAIGLCRYQAHPEAETKRKRGPEVRTTWLAADLRKKTLEDKCKWIAASIYREKLDQLMYGEKHWSHVEHIRRGRTNGDVKAG